MGGVSFHMENRDFIVRPHLTNLNKQFFCNSRPPWLFIQTNNHSIQLFPVSCYSPHLEPQHLEKITPTKKRRICVIISWWTFPSKLGFNMKKGRKGRFNSCWKGFTIEIAGDSWLVSNSRVYLSYIVITFLGTVYPIHLFSTSIALQ